MADGDGNDGAGEKTFTQADVDRIVRERIGREREKYADYDDLKQQAAEADKNKSAMDKLLEKVSGLEDRAAKAEAQNLRNAVAAAKGLSAKQAKRLQGSTREELEADADELLADWKPAGDGKGDGGKQGSGDAGGKQGGDGAADGEGKQGSGGAPGSGQDGGDGDGRRSLPPSGRPKEQLTSGSVPSSSGDKTPAEMAESILKSSF
ncbi:hypothetical protein [Mangrovihabitans endophyticus]|nr:hypothetical protein [Mangrovihabitans endophyticus]